MRSIWNEPFYFQLAACLLVAMVAAALLEPRFTDSSYLTARYAQNLVDGGGLGYNPGERVLLTPAPLVILAQAALSGGVVSRPPVSLAIFLTLATALALYHILDSPRSYRLVAIALLILTLVWGVSITETWLAALGLLAVALGQQKKWGLAGWAAGFMGLVAPLGIFFLLLLAALGGRRTLWGLLPIVGWWGFAFAYYGGGGLRGLTLPAAEHAPISLLLLLPVVFWLVQGAKKTPPLLLTFAAWGLLQSALFPDGVILLAVAGATCAVHVDYSPLHWRVLHVGMAIVFAGGMLIHRLPAPLRAIDLPRAGVHGSVGHFGDKQAALGLGGTVYQLAGRRDPHLYNLRGDGVGMLIATAPDYLLTDTLPDSRAIELLRYTAIGAGIWQRGAMVAPWLDAQPLNIDFSPDLRLIGITPDRDRIGAGGILRLRLDWELPRGKYPDAPLLFQFNALDFQQVSFGSIEQEVAASIWQTEQVTTYHVIPLNADTLPGRYSILLTLGYDGGIVGEHPVMRLKLPGERVDAPPLSPVARFDDGHNRADLLEANISEDRGQIRVELIWVAGSRFDASYTVFVHLTTPEDATPLLQADYQPMGGRFPTDIWDIWDKIVDIHTLDTMSLPAGDYVIRAGFYHPDRGRIPIVGGGDAVIIGKIHQE